MNSKISFKLINEKNYDFISFYGQTISLKDLKDKILVRLGQTKVTGPLRGKDRYRNKDDILLYDEFKQLITGESTLIASDKKVLVERISIPLHLVGVECPYYTGQWTRDHNKLSFNEIETRYLIPRTRYFIVRSTCLQDIERSIRESSWTTTNNNEITLNKALSKSKNVILIFSATNNSQFQGYARMIASPTSSKYSIWQSKGKNILCDSLIKVLIEDCMNPGNAIKLAWLRVNNVNFSSVSHLQNKLNNHDFITTSRTTQEEIPEEVGLELCRMFEYPDNKHTRKGSFLGLLASEISTRVQTDDERSQSEREGGMDFFEDRVDLLGDVNISNPTYFGEDWEELSQKGSKNDNLEEQSVSANGHSIVPSRKESESLSQPEPMIVENHHYKVNPVTPAIRPPFVRPAPPSTPCPQMTQLTSVHLPRYVPNDESFSSRMKEKRNRGVKTWEKKNWSRDGRSEKERERDQERSRDNSMAKSKSSPKRQ